MAAWAAALIGSGTSKWGWPMLKLTGSLRLRASSKTLRMPEDSMWRIRSAIQRSCMRVDPYRVLPDIRSRGLVLEQPLTQGGKLLTQPFVLGFGLLPSSLRQQLLFAGC